MGEFRRIYFPFVDNEVAYSCAECKALCCRGRGFGLTLEELTDLERRYPALTCFIRASGTRDYFSVQDAGPRCFFLEEDGRCGIHARDGFLAKPFVCKTFPANQFYLIEDTLLVGLHPLCPVGPPTGHPDECVLDHGELTRLITRLDETVAKRAIRLRREGGPSIVSHEEWCRDLASRIGGEGVIEVTAHWISAAASWSPGRPAHPWPSPTDAHRASALRFQDVLADFLGDPPARTECGDDIDAHVVSLAPRLRLGLLTTCDWIEYETLLQLFPRVLLAARLLAELAASISAAPRRVSLARALVEDNSTLYLMLANLDRVPRIESVGGGNVRVAGTLAGPIREFFAQVRRNDDADRASLGQMLAPMSIRERLLFLRSFPPEALRCLRFDRRQGGTDQSSNS